MCLPKTWVSLPPPYSRWTSDRTSDEPLTRTSDEPLTPNLRPHVIILGHQFKVDINFSCLDSMIKDFINQPNPVLFSLKDSDRDVHLGDSLLNFEAEASILTADTDMYGILMQAEFIFFHLNIQTSFPRVDTFEMISFEVDSGWYLCRIIWYLCRIIHEIFL